MAERLTPPIYLRISGGEWRVVVTYGVLLDCEGVSGVPMLTAGPEIERPSGRLLRGLLWAVLRRAGGGHTVEQAGGLLTRRNAAEVHAALLRGWAVSMPSGGGRGGGCDRGPEVRTWMDCWALATARDGLGLPDGQWLEYTPRMVHALSEERLEAIRQREYMVSMVAATVANWSVHAPKPALKDGHFMRHPWPENEAKMAAAGASMGDQFMVWMQEWKKWNPIKLR